MSFDPTLVGAVAATITAVLTTAGGVLAQIRRETRQNERELEKALAELREQRGQAEKHLREIPSPVRKECRAPRLPVRLMWRQAINDIIGFDDVPADDENHS